MEYYKVHPYEIRRGFSENPMYVLMLHQSELKQNIPMLIGGHEADMIMVELEHRHARRPMTHQLLANLCDAFALNLKRATIDRCEEGLFYATLYVTDGFVVRKLDCRATDAILLALHADVDIEASRLVLDEAGVPVSDDEADPSSAPSPAEAEASEPSIEELTEMLHRCEAQEEYEQAAELQRRIELLQGRNKA